MCNTKIQKEWYLCIVRFFNSPWDNNLFFIFSVIDGFFVSSKKIKNRNSRVKSGLWFFHFWMRKKEKMRQPGEPQELKCKWTRVVRVCVFLGVYVHEREREREKAKNPLIPCLKTDKRKKILLRQSPFKSYF